MILKNTACFAFLILLSENVMAQTTIHLNVDAGSSTSVMPPIWRDQYETHLLGGYGSDPSATGPHISYLSDPAFATEMAKLQPRFIRVSIGRMDNPPDTSYSSTHTAVLRNLPYEFYKGANTLTAANDPANYDFSYVDSLITVVQSTGAQPFITIDYMPFTLSSDTIPEYQALLPLVYYLAYDNKIRNAPPANNAVYGRVMYHLIKHCFTNYGVTYFEHWNEPDQHWLNPVMVKFFWTGDEYQLYDAYAAIADEVSADPLLADHVKLGGCSFAFYSLFNLIPIRFLQSVQANNKKFDFLSFHPYADTAFAGGYDSSKVSIATSLRDAYVPDAELINAEWGRIDVTTDTYGDLDYGLDKFRHIIDMLDRNISMSHEVCLFDAEAAADNFASLGMYRVGPIVPKPSAFVFYHLNKMNETLNRLPLTLNPGMYALAGKNDEGSKVVIMLPAENPGSGSNTVALQVANLPWGSGACYATRYELTEMSYLSGVVFHPTATSISYGGQFTDTLTYTNEGNSGRLIVWELSDTAPTGITQQSEFSNKLQIFPNPNPGMFEVKWDKAETAVNKIIILNHLGQKVYERTVPNNPGFLQVHSGLPPGMYTLLLQTKNGSKLAKLLIH